MKLLLPLIYRLYGLTWRITRPLFVGVRIILIQDEQVLLVQHTYEHHWYFPGGAVKRGELLVDAAMREAQEESGVVCRATPRLLGMYMNLFEGKNDHIAVFVCHDFQVGKASDRWEIAACRFFPVTALPAEIAPGCARRLQDYQTGPGPYVGKW